MKDIQMKPMTVALFPDSSLTQMFQPKRSSKSAWTTLNTAAWILNATRRVLVGLAYGSGVAL